MALLCFVFYKTITFSLASSCVSVLNELWPFKCLKVTADSLQWEKRFSVSKLPNDGPSISMRSRVSSPNLVCSTYFSLCSCKKNHAHKRQYCYDCHNFKQNGNYLISSPLRETNSLIVHVNYWSLPIIFSQNNGQCFFDIT